jgi:accessory gene regulator protein AgrB
MKNISIYSVLMIAVTIFVVNEFIMFNGVLTNSALLVTLLSGVLSMVRFTVTDTVLKVPFVKLIRI